VGGAIGIFCWGIGGILCIVGVGVAVYGIIGWAVSGITSVLGVWGTGDGVIWVLCCRVVWYGCVGIGVVYDGLVVLELVWLMLVRVVLELDVGLAESQGFGGAQVGSGGCGGLPWSSGLLRTIGCGLQQLLCPSAGLSLLRYWYPSAT
jgi:hypothetical protein